MKSHRVEHPQNQYHVCEPLYVCCAVLVAGSRGVGAMSAARVCWDIHTNTNTVII